MLQSQINQRELERQRKLQSMFLNYRVLEEKVRGMMSRYGIRNMDPEIMFMMSEAMKSRYTNIIQDLIAISRSSQSNSYLINKNSTPREITQVTAYNIVNPERIGGPLGGPPTMPSNPPTANALLMNPELP